MPKNQATVNHVQVKNANHGHSDKLKSELMVLGKALQARPSELRGTFNLSLASDKK